MRLPVHPRDWEEDAACFGVQTDIFYPPRIREKYQEIASEARSYCFGGSGKAPCPVRRECLAWAINVEEEHGIFGGYSHRERNALVRRAKKLGVSVYDLIQRETWEQ